jgi:hypothetical protein
VWKHQAVKLWSDQSRFLYHIQQKVSEPFSDVRKS